MTKNSEAMEKGGKYMCMYARNMYIHIYMINLTTHTKHHKKNQKTNARNTVYAKGTYKSLRKQLSRKIGKGFEQMVHRKK